MIFDVAIVGAGPAGATCALALQKSGLKVILLDKSTFPRDKACGDAIPALVGHTLKKIDPDLLKKLEAQPWKMDTKGTKVISPAGHHFTYTFQTHGWCAQRLDFDLFLVNAIDANQVQLSLGNKVQKITREEHWKIETEKAVFQARFIVGADGANGVVARQAMGHSMDGDNHCAAVRGYFDGVRGMEDGMMEIHLIRGFLPGYFWIFPLPNGRANVGVGMMRNEIASKNIVLRKELLNLIQTEPSLRDRFSGSSLLGEIKGFGLPMAGNRTPLSADACLLCGDAADLVDPATGEGIGHAVFSGFTAAQTIMAAFQHQRMDAAWLKRYDETVYFKLLREMRQKRFLQKHLANKPRTLDLLIRMAGRPGLVHWAIKKLF